MLSCVQNLSFKALYYPPNVKFTDGQMRSIENIKAQLDMTSKEISYYVEPAKYGDVVKLYRVKETQQDKSDNTKKYKNREYVGTYDEYHKFKPENRFKNGALILGLITFGSLAVCSLSKFSTKVIQKVKAKTELIMPASKDSINNANDTLRLVKK